MATATGHAGGPGNTRRGHILGCVSFG